MNWKEQFQLYQAWDLYDKGSIYVFYIYFESNVKDLEEVLKRANAIFNRLEKWALNKSLKKLDALSLA